MFTSNIRSSFATDDVNSLPPEVVIPCFSVDQHVEDPVTSVCLVQITKNMEFLYQIKLSIMACSSEYPGSALRSSLGLMI